MEHPSDRGGREAVDGVVAEARAGLSEAAAAVKPRLRGWLHLGAVPASAAAGIVLVVSAPAAARLSAAVYAVSVTALFATSATYHRGHWAGRTRAILQRLDHSMIFVLIAGTYTPFAALALQGAARTAVLLIVWLGALAGIVLRVGFRSLPRAAFVLVYVLLGWVGIAVLEPLSTGAGLAVVVLILTGGALYSVGAAVYATKRPNPSPAWFGFHEVFHAFTIAAFVVHYVAVSLTVYRVA